MERGVVIGGILISASFLFALLLDRSADSPVPISAPIKEISDKTNAQPRSGTRSGTPEGGTAAANESMTSARTTSAQSTMRGSPIPCVPVSKGCPAKDPGSQQVPQSAPN